MVAARCVRRVIGGTPESSNEREARAAAAEAFPAAAAANIAAEGGGGTAPGAEPELGVTLVELMVALAIFIAIAGAVLLVWQRSQDAYFRGAGAAQIQQ